MAVVGKYSIYGSFVTWNFNGNGSESPFSIGEYIFKYSYSMKGHMDPDYGEKVQGLKRSTVFFWVGEHGTSIKGEHVYRWCLIWLILGDVKDLYALTLLGVWLHFCSNWLKPPYPIVGKVHLFKIPGGLPGCSRKKSISTWYMVKL